MAVVGYNTVLRQTGTPTAFTSEAFSATTAANQWQINSSAFEVFDRTASLTFRTSTGGAISSTDVSVINYLFGKVTFNSTHPTVVADGTYLPLTNVAGAHSYSLNMGGDVLDDTDFTSTGYRSRVLGLRDVSLSVTRWDTVNNRFFNQLRGSTGSTMLVGDVQPGGSGPIARGYFIVESDDRSGDVGSLESGDLSLQLDGSTAAGFAWSDL